jgi:hypothetical protein
MIPPSACINTQLQATGNNGSWGVHGRILPYLEQGNLYNQVDLSIAWDFQMAIDGLKIPSYACPSDPKADILRDNGAGRPKLYPTTYGFSFGTWFVFNPLTGQGGDGAFYPNSKMKLGNFIDGTSNTLLTGEVKAWNAYNRNGGPPSTAVPQNVADVQAAVASGTDFKETGHTEWPDGRVHHQGFTTTLTPNTDVPYTRNGILYDADYNSWQEGRNGINGQPTYAAITSRSYHTGGVHVGLADGSARFVSENIDLTLWRGLGTRDGSEVLGEF